MDASIEGRRGARTLGARGGGRDGTHRRALRARTRAAAWARRRAGRVRVAAA
ncbi:MAG: hypothetical protein LC746_00705 [Acidobacteria bacterium]|nr:hypothetical protein [Acidobacteriota bacterium]